MSVFPCFRGSVCPLFLLSVQKKILNVCKYQKMLMNIYVLRNHKGGREGVSQMLMFACAGGGGWVNVKFSSFFIYNSFLIH